jgi:type III restriction enzyme
MAIGKVGVEATETAASAPVVLEERDIELPDVLTDLQDKTQLTRRSIFRILADSERLEDFTHNPQQFIELNAEAINRAKRLYDKRKMRPEDSPTYKIRFRRE